MNKPKFKVMIVDDEPTIIRTVRRYFMLNALLDTVEFYESATFQEALVQLEAVNPNIIIQDINLPDGNGLQFIKQAKKKYPMIQFIVITGASDLDRAMEALSFGAVDYLKKPVDMEMLADVVREALRRCERWGELLWSEYMAEEGAEDAS
ncbi:MAG: response regulator [Magnetococcales bacterium]|nr:response regulator [Magnetococcales bacterium]